MAHSQPGRMLQAGYLKDNLEPVLFTIYIISMPEAVESELYLPMTRSSTRKYTQTQIRKYSKMTSERGGRK